MKKGIYKIGLADIWVGKTKRYIGKLNNASIKTDEEKSELEIGFPKTVEESVVTKQTVTLSSETHNISSENLAMLLKTSVKSIGEGTAVITDEPITFADKTTTLALKNEEISSVSIKNAPSSQQIWEDFADGTKGNVSGDYKLPYPITAVSDVATVTVNGEVFPVKAVGSAETTDGANSVEVVTAAGADNGKLQFFKGNGTTADAIKIDGLIRIIFTPVPAALVAGTDYNVDSFNGAIIPISSGGIVTGQEYFVTYTKKTYTSKEIGYGGSTQQDDTFPIYLEAVDQQGRKTKGVFHKARIANGLDYSLDADWHKLPIEFLCSRDETQPEGKQIFVMTIEE